MSIPTMGQFSRREAARGLVLLVVLLPLFFFPNLINLYRLPKFALLAFLVAVLSWLSLLAFISRGEKERPVLPLFVPLVIYLFLHGLSLLNTVNAYTGTTHFLNLTLGVTLFWIAVNHLERESITGLFPWIVAAGAAVSSVGIAQAWGLEIPALEQVSPPSSTFGSRNMAGHYILFVLPVAYYLLLSCSRPALDWIYSLAAALITTYLIYMRSRAAWGAVIATFFLWWLCLRVRGHTTAELLQLGKRKWAFVAGIGVFVLSMNLFPPHLLPNWMAGSDSVIARFASMTDLEHDSSAQERFAIWANSLAIFRDHPLLGVGVGNFGLVYPLYNRRLIKDSTFSVGTKAAEVHNDYIQRLAEVGLLGTAAFLWVLIVLARRYWRSLKENLDPAALAVAFALTAIILDAFWDFPLALPVPTAFFWIYAGLLWILTSRHDDQPVPRALALATIGLLAVLNTAAATLNVMHLQAEYYYSRAVLGDYQAQNIKEKMDLAGKDFHRAIRLYPYDYHYHYWMALLRLRQGKNPEALQANLKALALHPYDINTLNNLGVIYAALGNFPRAIQAYQTALKIWPDYVMAHNSLGVLYEKTGQKEKAVQEFRATLQIDPANKLANDKMAALLNEK